MVLFPYLIIKQVITAGVYALRKCLGTHSGQIFAWRSHAILSPYHSSCWHFTAIIHLQTRTNNVHPSIRLSTYIHGTEDHKQGNPDSTFWQLEPHQLSASHLNPQPSICYCPVYPKAWSWPRNAPVHRDFARIITLFMVSLLSQWYR